MVADLIEIADLMGVAEPVVGELARTAHHSE